MTVTEVIIAIFVFVNAVVLACAIVFASLLLKGKPEEKDQCKLR